MLDRQNWEHFCSRLPVRPIIRQMFDRRREARSYIFDPQASFKLGELVRDCLDLLVDNIEFARAPYPMTYIEVDMRDLWRGWRPGQPHMETMDLRAGYLIENGRVVVIAEGPDKNRGIDPDIGAGVWNFTINRPQVTSMGKILRMPEQVAELGKLAYIFGGQRQVDAEGNVTALYLPEVTWEGPAGNLLQDEMPGGWSHTQVAAHFDLNKTYRDDGDGDAGFNALFQGGGDPVIVLACLLVLNQPSKYLRITDRPKGAGVSPEGKVRSWNAHRVVEVRMGERVKVRKLLHLTQRAGPVRHEVEGHWKNFNKHPGCTHHWEPVGPERSEDGGYKKYWCPRCLQRRTRVDSFERGDASRGYVTKHYEVKE